MTDTDGLIGQALDEALATGGIHSVFQRIVELDSGRVVAYEALARGPEGPLQRPELLFAAARAAGRLAELDALCRTAAFRGARVAPRSGVTPGAGVRAAAPPRAPVTVGMRPISAAGDALLRGALAATTSGVTISDMRQPDQPLMYVNEAFEQLAGLTRDEVLGRNCRFLRSADTDRAAIARIRAAIDRGEECRETVLNTRGAERTPWWNEIHLSPVFDDAGTLVHYIGVQHGVTARV